MPKKKEPIEVSDKYYITAFKHSDEFSYDNGLMYGEIIFGYELTVTFNQRFHTKASAISSYQTLVRKLLTFHEVEILNVVAEYQKNGFVHYHCHLISKTEIAGEDRWNTMKAFERMFGMTTFRPTHNDDSFENYYLKDVNSNYESRGFEHLYQYIRKDVS